MMSAQRGLSARWLGEGALWTAFAMTPYWILPFVLGTFSHGKVLDQERLGWDLWESPYPQPSGSRGSAQRNAPVLPPTELGLASADAA
ncbi:hypothetical protein NUW54_g7690 [Trametes sanguinea]|uniref:Uncharacterized protein n=1 Tax=Trametes sanguinea TaxID=158606 RepID=A0ACC1PLE1_9APHY|nr:hypothetical protein NUW54_g7690 [Trametes sanguinea]